MTILDRTLATTPFAVIDIETTGLSPHHDRIVELAVFVVKSGEEPKLVFDSLINPERPISGTEIHGLTDADVGGAPTFRDLFDTIVSVLSNRVLVAHNASFDVGFLSAELERCGYPCEPPHMCTMQLPSAIDPEAPGRLSLRHACLRQEINLSEQHRASADAQAVAQLLARMLELLRRRGVRTFGDLRGKSTTSYRFLESFGSSPIPSPPVLRAGHGLRPRSGGAKSLRKAGIAQYLEELVQAAADLRLDDGERARLLALPAELALDPAEVRAVHAKVFWGMLSRFVEDARVDPAEAGNLRRLFELLSQLGWAPGEAP
jgi:DNA polymerase-3 subunit epsilon